MDPYTVFNIKLKLEIASLRFIYIYDFECIQNLIMQHVDHSAGDLIDLLQGLLRYEPAERLKAREALGHPFFTRDLRRFGYL